MMRRILRWSRSGRSFALGRAAAAMLAVTVAAACGSTGSSGTPDMAVLPPDLVLADLKAPDYPAGPYGASAGDVLPNFTFKGYWSPTSTTGLSSSQTFGEVSFDMLRTSGAKYAIVALSAFW